MVDDKEKETVKEPDKKEREETPSWVQELQNAMTKLTESLNQSKTEQEEPEVQTVKVPVPPKPVPEQPEQPEQEQPEQEQPKKSKTKHFLDWLF